MVTFWDWILRYSSLLVTAALSLLVGWLLDRITTWRARLIYYTTQPQYVPIPGVQPGQPTHIGVMTLFLWNAGKAPAREVNVAHTFSPPHNVFPDIPRDDPATMPGGAFAIRFATFPARTLVSISYLVFPPSTAESLISYVGSEHGPAKRIPVMLQRIFPPWFIRVEWVVLVLGMWVTLNFLVTLIKFLWRAYYSG